MDYGRFDLYEENGKCGVIDKKTNRVILHCSYDVDDFRGDFICLKDGRELNIDDVICKCEWLFEKQRYMLVENPFNNKVGIYDNKNGVLKLACECDRIEYMDEKNGFLIFKNNKSKELSFDKLDKMKYSGKGDKVIPLNNISLYYADPLYINLKNGKKVDFIR